MVFLIFGDKVITWSLCTVVIKEKGCRSSAVGPACIEQSTDSHIKHQIGHAVLSWCLHATWVEARRFNAVQKVFRLLLVAIITQLLHSSMFNLPVQFAEQIAVLLLHALSIQFAVCSSSSLFEFFVPCLTQLSSALCNRTLQFRLSRQMSRSGCSASAVASCMQYVLHSLTIQGTIHSVCTVCNDERFVHSAAFAQYMCRNKRSGSTHPM